MYTPYQILPEVDYFSRLPPYLKLKSIDKSTFEQNCMLLTRSAQFLYILHLFGGYVCINEYAVFQYFCPMISKILLQFPKEVQKYPAFVSVDKCYRTCLLDFLVFFGLILNEPKNLLGNDKESSLSVLHLNPCLFSHLLCRMYNPLVI